MPHRTSRETFLASPNRKAFEEISQSAAFDEACRATMLTYIEEQAIQRDPNAACAQNYMIMGARQVIDMLREIHLKPEEPKPTPTRTLRPPS